MTKSELVRAVAGKIKDFDAENKENGGYNKLAPKAKAEKSIDFIVESIVEGLKEDGKVAISGFGTFEVRERAEKECINPRTKEKMTVPGYKAAVFKCGRNLKEAVNKE